jgi:D-glycero-beta-D-manno-heptose 1-phosphate adenylyltransferase
VKTLKNIESKIYFLHDLSHIRQHWKEEHLQVVFTNGCFDIIHRGHIDYLSKSADLGQKLIIGVNSDSSVKKLKGPGRPLQDEKSRLMILASLAFVDAVVLFEEETPYKLISMLQPDILVKGGDYTEDKIVGADIVKSLGGKVVVLPFLEGYSTTSIEKKIFNCRE